MADDLGDTILERAAEPQSATADGVTINQRTIDDLIKADKYLLSKTAAHADPRKAFCRVKIVAPGAV